MDDTKKELDQQLAAVADAGRALLIALAGLLALAAIQLQEGDDKPTKPAARS